MEPQPQAPTHRARWRCWRFREVWYCKQEGGVGPSVFAEYTTVSWPLRHRGRFACTWPLERRTAGCVLFVTCYLLLIGTIRLTLLLDPISDEATLRPERFCKRHVIQARGHF